MARPVLLPETFRNALQDHARVNLPNESCAVLYGRTEPDQVVIDEIFFVHNEDSSPVSFSISASQLLEAYRKADENRAAIVGIFHSHPSSGAVPSGKDIKFMEVNPVIWIIYSGPDACFRAFVLDPDVVELDIVP